MKCTHTFEVAASPAAVWEWVGDPTQWPQWMATVKSVEPKDGTTVPEHGAVYSLRRPWEFAGDCRLTQVRPPSAVEYVLSGTSAPARGSFTLDSDSDGRVSVTSTLSFEGLTAAYLEIFGGGDTKIEDQMVADAVRLRRLVEAR